MKTYTYEEVRNASIEYFQGDELSADVFAGKYALQDLQGNIYEKTPVDMHRRLAKEFARVELKYPNSMSEEEIYDLFSDWSVIPQGGPMAAIGNSHQVQSLSNCFVIESPYDSYGGILKTDQEEVQIMKRRGGVGFDISTLRPKGQVCANAARTTDGIGVFMERYSNSCREVAQEGRRGALMLTISCFVGSTPILTEDGWLTIKSMVDQKYSGRVWTHEGFKEIDAYQSPGERDVYEVECENGKKIAVTADHKFVVQNTVTGEEYLKPICEVDPEVEELVFYDVQLGGTSMTRSTSKIRKITKASREPVYDFTVRDVHRINANGFYTSNCHHPDVLTFANIKRNKEKVTGANISIRVTNEFMHAVRSGGQYQQRFPVEKDVPHDIEKMVNAKEVWDNIVLAMRDCSEPGMLFWDAITSRSPADAYAKFGYETVSTNPCLTGDTKIAVADGRGYVSIKQLADDGLDVPVYCHQANTGKMIIRQMRNPRLTGQSVPVFKVTIEGGHTFKATGNHTMIMRDGTRTRVDELVAGDQLMISKRIERTLVEMGSVPRSNNPNHYVMLENDKGKKAEHRLIWEFHHGPVPVGHVIHHVDFDSKNNHIDNMRCMTYGAHHELHATVIRGENNPIFKIKADPVRFAAYSAKMSESVSGNNNPRAYDVDQVTFLENVKSLTKALGRRVTKPEWHEHAAKNSLPLWPNTWRSGGQSFYRLTVSIAKELGFKHVDVDGRLLRTLDKAVAQGYVADIVGNEVVVNRTCEWCNEAFTNTWGCREIAFCSNSCSNFYVNRIAGKNEARAASLKAMHVRKAETSRNAILDCYTELRFKLGRELLQDELRDMCKLRKVSYRTGTKNGFKDWADVKMHAAGHNHRVVSVEPCGIEDVYNGTVDEEHTYCFGGWDIGNNENLQIHSLNCGEITLSKFDSCRLLLVNLSKFVEDPFTSSAKFNYDKFSKTVQKSQRLMDDLIDLELEAIDRIISKIKNDPEPDDIKRTELELWKKIKNAALNGRRTGLGITALGDTFAYLGIAYGSDASISLTEEIYKSLAINSYTSSILMAKERGAFPIFSHDVEKNHPFITQILDAIPHDIRDQYSISGRRNIANTTTPPAGSTSIVAKTTSGCEPVLFVEAIRNRKINPSDKSARVDKVDAKGDKWQSYKVFHHGVKKWMEVTGETDISKSPYHGSTVEEIDWLKKVDIQASAQKWICHSISNCVVGSSLVETTSGLMYIDELVDTSVTTPKTFYDVSVTIRNHLMQNVNASSFYDNGVSDVVTVNLSNGLTITCTPNERLALQLINGTFVWKYVSELAIGDLVVLKTDQQYIHEKSL